MSKSEFIARLERANGWRLWTSIFVIALLAVELIIVVMDYVLIGHIVKEDILIGVIATTLVEPTHLIFVIFILGEFAKSRQDAFVVSAQYANSRLSVAIENSQMIIWELDIAKGELHYDDAMLRLLDMPTYPAPHDIEGWLALVYPDDRKPFMERFHLAMQADDTPFDLEYRLVQPSGQLSWVQTRGKIIQRDAAGNPLMAVGSTMNVTAQKQMEATLLQQLKFTTALNKISSMLAANDDLDFILHDTIQVIGEVLGADRALIYDIDMEQEQVIGLSEWLDPQHPETKSSKGMYPLSTFIGGTTEMQQSRTWFTSHSDAVNASLLQDDSGVLLHQQMGIQSLLWYPFAFRESGYYVLVLNQIYAHKSWAQADIDFLDSASNIVGVELEKNRMMVARIQSEYKLRSIAAELELANAHIEEERATLAERVKERTTQLQFASRAKDSFLATMSHEIRTPLGGMLGMLEMLSLSPLNLEQREKLAIAQTSGKSLLRIVNDILDWSKIEAGKLELSPHSASIADMLNSVASTYTQLASDKGITLKVELDPQLSAQHIFDPLRLSQILNNFTSNAVKFTSQGSVEIGAQRHAHHHGYETVRFSVKDSGDGIDPEQQSRLFQHYEQATADIARMYGGTGLGLAICRRLAELMDGTLGFESTPGVGSTFYLTINLTVADAMAPAGQPRSLAQTKQHADQTDVGSLLFEGHPISVLIVDDHPVNRMLLKQQLGVLGITVETAESGTPALSFLRNGRFDLMITDCHMPEMDGYQLTRCIRQLEQQAGSRRIPIIAWTANVLAEEADRCKAAGMDDILTKPTELSGLRTMLLKWMAKTGTPERFLDADSQL